MRISVQLVALAAVAFATGCATALTPRYGISGGTLYPCPTSRACVSSQADDEAHAVAPLAYRADRREARADLIAAIHTFEGVRIVSSHRNYVRAEFPSKALRNPDRADFYFQPRAGVDDVEFWFPPGASVIHVRSSSRLGLLDLGENRERVETLRQVFERIQARKREPASLPDRP